MTKVRSMSAQLFPFEFTLSTQGETDIIDITPNLESGLKRSGIGEGVLSIFVSGSTAGITTVEYEPGLIQDLKEAFERLAPRHGQYAHEMTWHDGNGYAHVRASLLGPGLTIPVRSGRLLLGTWQQIILIDFDNRSRHRTLTGQVIGT